MTCTGETYSHCVSLCHYIIGRGEGGKKAKRRKTESSGKEV